MNKVSLVCLFLLSLVNLGCCGTQEIKWDKQLDLRKDSKAPEKDVILHMMSTKEDAKGNRWLFVKISAPTVGYVAAGFSVNGGMDGGNMAIGWVDSKGAHVHEYHAVQTTVSRDKHQDVELVHGEEEKGRTTITFKRLWNTCDSKDVVLTTDTMKLIWAYGPKDPVNGNGEYHGVNRGMKHTFLLDDGLIGSFPSDKDKNIKHIDFQMKDNLIGPDPSTYYCKIVKFPKLDKKHHMIGYKPLLNPETIENVHHITAYECYVTEADGGTEKKFEKFITHKGGKCYTPQMPKEWAKHCFTFLFVWLVGSEGEMFPQHVGNPLREEYGGPSYIMLEMHYTNAGGKPFTDSTGVRIYYTDKLRKYDASIILAGYRITPFMALPPKQPNFKLNGICTSECTKATIPKEGLKVFGVILHAHLTARKLRTRHFRDGKELAFLAVDNAYDFHYQQARYFKEEKTILPGDELIMECEFDSTDRVDMTLGGMESVQEMCQTFIFYYPRIAMDYCASQQEFHSFFNAVGIQNVSGPAIKAMDMPYSPKDDQVYEKNDDSKSLEDSEIGAHGNVFDTIKIDAPSNLTQYTAGQYMRDVAKWDDPSFSKSVQKGWDNGNHYAFCSTRGKRRVPLKKYIMPLRTKGISRVVKNQKKTC